MKPEQQRIAIAEACPGLWSDRGFIWSNQGYLVHPFKMLTVDPLNDLNAMHEAEKIAGFHENTPEGRALTQKYAHSLGYHTESWKGYAVAAQRAEAFLRTLNLWIED